MKTPAVLDSLSAVLDCVHLCCSNKQHSQCGLKSLQYPKSAPFCTVFYLDQRFWPVSWTQDALGTIAWRSMSTLTTELTTGKTRAEESKWQPGNSWKGFSTFQLSVKSKRGWWRLDWILPQLHISEVAQPSTGGKIWNYISLVPHVLEHTFFKFRCHNPNGGTCWWWLCPRSLKLLTPPSSS